MIIGISGLAWAGKDTSADFLVKDHLFAKVALADPMKRICREVYAFTEDQLWGPSQERNAPDHRYPRTQKAKEFLNLYNFLSTAAQWRDAILKEFGKDAPTHFLTPRYALQQLGSEWARCCYIDTWVDMTLRIAGQLLAPGAIVAYSAKTGLRDWRVGDPEVVRGVVISDVRFKSEMNAIKRAGGSLVRIVRPGAGLEGSAGQHGSETEQLEISDGEFDLIINNNSTLEVLREMISLAVTARGTK